MSEAKKDESDLSALLCDLFGSADNRQYSYRGSAVPA